MNDNHAYTQEEINKALFTQLIMMFATSAMQQMGKLVNPATKKADVDLEAAQSTIDVLDMLEAKTKGNLDKDEAQMLKEAVASLKLTFVETMQQAPTAPAAPEQPAEKPGIVTPPGAGEGKKEADENARRFHKTY